MTKTTEFTSIAKVRKAVQTILDNTTDFDKLLDDLTELDDRADHFVVLLMTGDDMGEGFDDDSWYIHIYNVRTDKEVNFDVTDLIDSLD